MVYNAEYQALIIIRDRQSLNVLGSNLVVLNLNTIYRLLGSHPYAQFEKLPKTVYTGLAIQAERGVLIIGHWLQLPLR